MDNITTIILSIIRVSMTIMVVISMGLLTNIADIKVDIVSAG